MRILVLLVLLFSGPGTGACSNASSADEARIQTLLTQGRALLDTGRPIEAEAQFALAAEQDGDSLRTRMWVLRAWMDQGRSDETLAAIDALDRAGTKGLEMSYLYGMAFARRGEGAVASGTLDGSVEMVFQDAVKLLQEVVAAQGERYPDAYLPLARSAWYTRDLETARAAADEAVSLAPEASEAWLARGRIVLSQYVAAESESAASARADELWGMATGSFRRAIELLGSPNTEFAARSLAGASTDLAHALLWRQKTAEATEAFANAIAWAPEVPDYAEMQRLLGGAAAHGDDEAPVGFRAALESGRARLEERRAAAGGTGDPDPRAGTLLWWLGWARFVDADWTGSEEAFAACLARAPEITNSWFYVGLARQYRKDSEGALAAMHAGWDAHAETMVSTARGAGGSLRAFEGLIGWCMSQTPARNLDAAFLSELLTRALPGEARHWNNLGLFLRDEGERLEIEAHRRKEPRPDATLSDLYERSYAAYQRAHELAPDDPQLMNDTALMLQYHLRRDLERAEAMYRRSLELCEQRLAAMDLSADERALFEQTKSDASGNLAFLLAPEEDDLAATPAPESHDP